MNVLWHIVWRVLYFCAVLISITQTDKKSISVLPADTHRAMIGTFATGPVFFVVVA